MCQFEKIVSNQTRPKSSIAITRSNRNFLPPIFEKTSYKIIFSQRRTRCMAIDNIHLLNGIEIKYHYMRLLKQVIFTGLLVNITWFIGFLTLLSQIVNTLGSIVSRI